MSNKVQFRTIVEWELGGTAQDLMRALARVGVTSTTEQVEKALSEWIKPQRMLRGFSTPLSGYKKKEKPKVVEVNSVESEGTEEW